MRELTQDEMAQVVGGDGFVLGGGAYISSTRLVTGGLGIVGAVDVGYRAGYAIGTAVNAGTDAMFGSTLSEMMGGFAYNVSQGS